MAKFIYLFIFLVGFFSMEAQDSISTKAITSANNVKGIKKLKVYLKNKRRVDSININNYVKKHNISPENARGIEKISKDGIPRKLSTKSFNQITATNTNRITNNLVSGFNLTGNGIKAHVFDNGGIFTSHLEFDNRVSNYRLNNNVFDSHPTWVAGVMAAKGQRVTAKGMATKLSVIGDDFNRNRLLRMNEIAESGVLLSNHSYGFLAGWNIGDDGEWEWWGDVLASEMEDFSFGYYGEDDANSDLITLNSPFHLQVKSSANNNNTLAGGAGPGEGEEYYLNFERGESNKLNTSTTPRIKNCKSGFDCIPTGNISKNILVVGSVNPLNNPFVASNVKLSVFSSVGPTDDGRIKPDVVAVGFGVNTTGKASNDDYKTVDGTSFSAPSVAGIAALLQEQYLTTTGEYMRSDLVRSLLINTTNEAGATIGPDYKFGWGLVDAYKAALIIKNNGTSTYLDQFLLNQASTCSMEIKANAESKIKATLAWIDKEFTGYNYSPLINNRTKTLVNDLDLRVYKKSDRTMVNLPWKLQVESPNAAAIKADNDTDNVEQVEFTSDSTGEYIVEVTHKGNLVNPTNYSLVINAKPVTFCKVQEEKNELSIHFLDADRLYVKFPTAGGEVKYEFYIYDFTGKLINKSTESDYQISLKKFNLLKGNYIAVVKSSGKSESAKFSID